MSSSPEPRPRAALLQGVDRAALVVALTVRLRENGVRTDLDAARSLARALSLSLPRSLGELYWTARVCLVRHRGDLEAFDAVFDAAFGDADPVGEQLSPPPAPVRTRGERAPDGGPEDRGAVGGGLPWATLPDTDPSPGGEDDPRALPELLPSALEALAEAPFDRLSEGEVRQLGRWLEELRPQLPRRRGRRHSPGPGGRRVALRATLARARRTGWEPLELVRSAPVPRPRRVVALCDVSGSMRSQAAAYVHLMRAFALIAGTEAFAFGTRLTRLTPLLAHGTAEGAVARATGAVQDRFGGTRIAASLRELLASHHGSAVRGAVVVVASDGWDGDPPEEMAAVMARLRRRAHRVVWANPRAAAPGFEPSTGGMAAALPFCDALVPAHTFAALRGVVAAVAAETASRPRRTG